MRCEGSTSIVGFEEGGRGPWLKECVQILEAEKAREWVFPLSFQNEALPCRHLDFNPVRLMLDF